MSAQVAVSPGLKRRIVLLGPPASGKGTQAELIQAHYGFPVTSPGAMFREEKRRGTPLGIEADRLTRDGRLLPDEIVVRIVGSWLTLHAEEFVFDGFPRSLGQADALESLLETHGAPLQIALALEISVEQLEARVAGRMVCQSCGRIVGLGLHIESTASACPHCGGVLGRRADDNPETLRTRLAEYREKTEPLLGYYEQRGLLARIDSTRTPAEVFASVQAALGSRAGVLTPAQP